MSEVQCPKCGGPCWDNRVGKKNPKAPDFKCRDRSCDGVIWPPKQSNGRPPVQQAQPVSVGGYSTDGRDFLDGQTGHEAATVTAIQHSVRTPQQAERMAQLAGLYAQCLVIACDNVPKALETVGVKPDAQTIVAAAATLLIAADKRGIAA